MRSYARREDGQGSVGSKSFGIYHFASETMGYLLQQKLTPYSVVIHVTSLSLVEKIVWA